MTTNGAQPQYGHWSWLVALVACGCWFAPTASAEGTGFEAGLRVGYGIPLGDVAGGGDGSALSDAVSGQIPISIDLGYRILPNLFIGLYAQYGFAFVGDQFSDACDVTDVSCSAHDIRLGVQAHYHFLPREKLDPWIGVGLGYEWLSISVEGGGLEVSTTLHGFEFFDLQAGLDIAVGENFSIGPFLTLSFAQFSTLSLDCSSSSIICTQGFGASGDIDEEALHEWLILGVRGAFAP